MMSFVKNFVVGFMVWCAALVSVESQERIDHIHEGMLEHFHVDIWTDRGEASVYYPGDRLRVYFQPTHDCFVVVYSIDTEGNISVLYPYDYTDDPFVHGGRTRRIPDAWDHHDLLVSGPSGIEYIVAVASVRPMTIPHWRRYHDTRYEPVPGLSDHITGDPYEGMLHMTDLLIPAEHREYGYVTNSTYFYVERRVWYPRYMCYDCHWPRPVYFHPYVDVCVGFEIVIVDYDWYDDWAYWRPHHPPVRYRRGCWTVRKRSRSLSTPYTSERYSRRRGFKNIGFSKTDVEHVDRAKIREDLKTRSKVERRKGIERSTIPTRSGDTHMKENMQEEKRYSPERSNGESKYERRRDSTVNPERPPLKKSDADDVKKRKSGTSKKQRSFWEKITDWSKKSKSAPSVTKTKTKSSDRKTSKGRETKSPSKRTSSSKNSQPKKSAPSKKRR